MKNFFSNKITYVMLAAFSVIDISLKVITISHSKNTNSNTTSGVVVSKDVPPVVLNVNNTDPGTILTTEIENQKSHEAEFARLGINGDQIGFFSSTNSAIDTLYIIFLGDGMNITDSLTISNVNRRSPNYRIVNGDKHDWLVVTRITVDGTGLEEHEDDWYKVVWFV